MEKEVIKNILEQEIGYTSDKEQSMSADLGNFVIKFSEYVNKCRERIMDLTIRDCIEGYSSNIDHLTKMGTAKGQAYKMYSKYESVVDKVDDIELNKNFEKLDDLIYNFNNIIDIFSRILASAKDFEE